MFSKLTSPVPWAAFLTIGVAASLGYLANEKATRENVGHIRERVAVLESRNERLQRIEEYFDDMIKKALAAPTGRGR
jgi:hypothetical protein